LKFVIFTSNNLIGWRGLRAMRKHAVNFGNFHCPAHK
jgi:hypothetical protein